MIGSESQVHLDTESGTMVIGLVEGESFVIAGSYYLHVIAGEASILSECLVSSYKL